MALIQIRQLSKLYPGATVPAVDGVSLDIEAGEFITLLGPSGSGKTSTLMLLAGFEQATAGHILLDGQPIERLPAHQRGMGVVFQSYSLFPHMTVAQNVAFPLQVRKLPAAEVAAKVAAVLDTVRLGHLAQRRPAQLSGGQQQRVALARALVFAPRVVLMDEPLSALDKKLREEMQLEIRRLHRTLGVTMVFVTHDQAEAMTLSDRVAVFNHGRIVQLATPQQLYDAPADVFVAGFIGDNNHLAGQADGAGGLRTAGGLRLQARDTTGPAGGGQATLCVRPEHLRPARDGETLNRLDTTVLDAIHLGDHWRLVFRLGGAAGPGTEDGEVTWFAKLAPGALPAGLAPGLALPMAFDPQHAWLFAA
ncbi:MAG: ABC transporter ATP-binding protein [Pseudomonadota bacterium]